MTPKHDIQRDVKVERVTALALIGPSVFAARREEQDVGAEFGEEYVRYAKRTPAFLPRLDGLLARSHGA